jgi:P pilus assembly chaperone PapD
MTQMKRFALVALVALFAPAASAYADVTVKATASAPPAGYKLKEQK